MRIERVRSSSTRCGTQIGRLRRFDGEDRYVAHERIRVTKGLSEALIIVVMS